MTREQAEHLLHRTTIERIRRLGVRDYSRKLYEHVFSEVLTDFPRVAEVFLQLDNGEMMDEHAA